jgi:polysaccharide export outer membrane protein
MKSHRAYLTVVSLILLLSGSSLRAQQESLLIGPGDLVHILILDAPELEQHVRVTDSGDVPLLMGGKVRISGMTPEQAGDAVGKYLVDEHYLVNPKMSITVDQYATQNISVIGEVKLPGAYPVTTTKTVEEALALAGGLLPDADRDVVIQRHGTGEMVTWYSSNSPLMTPDSVAPGIKPATSAALRKRDTVVYPGDIVRVARAEMVFAVGDFLKPGGFPVINNDAHLTVLELVAFAGGANKTAALGSARLVRKHPDGKLEDIKLNLGQMQKGKKPDQELEANDVLYVPFSFGKNVLVGAATIAAAATDASVIAF